MNERLKRRLVAVTGVIAVVAIVVLAVIASSTGYKTLSVAEALDPSQRDARVQISGTVVDDSFSIEGNILNFTIFDPEGNYAEQLAVLFDGGVSATFGNGVTAICTGRINSEGVLICSELVTKCPSKYENATDALGVSQLLGYDASVQGKPVKVIGLVKPGSLSGVDEDVRLILLDEGTGEELPVVFNGALPDTIGDNSALVVTGALQSSGQLLATDVAQEGE